MGVDALKIIRSGSFLYDHLETLLRGPDTVIIVELHNIHTIRKIGDIDRHYPAVNQAVEILCSYRSSGCVIHFHTKIVVQRAVDLDIESSVIRIRIQYHSVILLQSSYSFRTIFHLNDETGSIGTTCSACIRIRKRKQAYASC